jgi:hypothetical protein
MKHAIAEIGPWDPNAAKVCANELLSCSDKNRNRIGRRFVPFLVLL